MDRRPLKLGDWTLDPGSRQLQRDAEHRSIEPKDYGVLLQLIECAPDVVPTAALLRRNWGDAVVASNCLYRAIGRLRKLVGDEARKPRYIQTLPKIGYRLLAQVREVAPLVANIRSCLGPVAVLPFDAYASEAENPHLVDVLWFELCRALAGAGIAVVSRESVVRACDENLDNAELGAALRARWLLSGAVILVNGQKRVTASLSSVETGYLAWSATMDVPAVQMFAAYTRLAAEISAGAVAGARATIDLDNLLPDGFHDPAWFAARSPTTGYGNIELQ